MKINQLAADLSKERDGTWVSYMETDLELKIASVKNPEYEEAARKLVRSKQKTLSKARIRNMTIRETMHMMAPVVARYILVDWRGLEDDKGEPIKYSYEKCLELLTDDRFFHLYETVLEIAKDGAEFMVYEDEEDLGNSSSFGNGTETGAATQSD